MRSQHAAPVTRFLAEAATSSAIEVERSVRAELLALLCLEDCWFTPDDHVEVPEIARDGTLRQSVLRYQRGGFELPQPSVALRVQAGGRVLGHVICVPTPGVGISIDRRRAAIALTDVWALALAGSREPAPGP
jgi:hypothetical protein